MLLGSSGEDVCAAPRACIFDAGAGCALASFEARLRYELVSARRLLHHAYSGNRHICVPMRVVDGPRLALGSDLSRVVVDYSFLVALAPEPAIFCGPSADYCGVIRGADEIIVSDPMLIHDRKDGVFDVFWSLVFLGGHPVVEAFIPQFLELVREAGVAKFLFRVRSEDRHGWQ